MTTTILVGTILTLLGMFGAAMGVLAAEHAAKIKQLMPFSAGLLLGIAVFLIFPEALGSGRWPVIIGFSVAGCVVIAVAENYLGHAHAEHDGAVAFGNWRAWAPLLVALSLHDALDGWNIGLACNLADPKLVWTFLAGMGLHKCTGGVASGAIFRASIRSTGRSLLAAAAAEALTFAGVMLEVSLRSILGERWTAWLLAATGGSFLYLAFHAMQQARRRENGNLTFRYAMLGFASVGLVSLLLHG
jgi:zinc transporter ZupT